MKRQFHRSPAGTRGIILILTLALGFILPAVQAAPGDLDTTFNAPNGYTTLADAQFFDVVIQPADGKILAAGLRLNSNGGNSSIVFARFNGDGTLDTNFAFGGVATTAEALQGWSYGFRRLLCCTIERHRHP
jgi:hypothetical protein